MLLRNIKKYGFLGQSPKKQKTIDSYFSLINPSETEEMNHEFCFKLFSNGLFTQFVLATASFFIGYRSCLMIEKNDAKELIPMPMRNFTAKTLAYTPYLLMLSKYTIVSGANYTLTKFLTAGWFLFVYAPIMSYTKLKALFGY